MGWGRPAGAAAGQEVVGKVHLVANPGCYAITAILGLVPLLRAGVARPDMPVGIHAVNGTTGAGNTPKKAVMHAETSGALPSYSLAGHTGTVPSSKRSSRC